MSAASFKHIWQHLRNATILIKMQSANGISCYRPIHPSSVHDLVTPHNPRGRARPFIVLRHVVLLYLPSPDVIDSEYLGVVGEVVNVAITARQAEFKLILADCVVP
jgi:hypothetical protein